MVKYLTVALLLISSVASAQINRRVALVYVTSPDYPISDIATSTQVLNSLNNFFSANSYGTEIVTGAAISLNANNNLGSETCINSPGIQAMYPPPNDPFWSILAQYTYTVWILPGSCQNFGGVSTGTQSWIWGLTFIVHELSHTIGALGPTQDLSHAHSESCVDLVCGYDEYGDIYDTLGSGFPAKQWSAPAKEITGIFARNGVPPLQLVNGNGTYSLGIYELGNAVAALKINKVIHYCKWVPENNGCAFRFTGTEFLNYYPSYLYVEARQDIGVIIHVRTNFSDERYLMDLDRGNGTQYVLGPNQSTVLYGITIRTETFDSNGAVVNISGLDSTGPGEAQNLRAL